MAFRRWRCGSRQGGLEGSSSEPELRASRLSGKGTEGGERQFSTGVKAEAEEAFVEPIAAAFHGWCRGGGQGELEESSSDPEL